jgi:hypothetical protein
VKNFVRGLIFDLRGRCDILLAELKEEKVHHDSKEYAERTRNRIVFVKDTLHHLLDRLDSNAAQYSSRNVFFDFKERSNEIQFHEYISIPFISRYQEPDMYFNRLLRLSCEQIGYPLAMPVGSTLGQAYYYSYPPEGIIVGPFLQAHSFLNLPDMFHEIGHLIFDQYKAYFERPFNDICARYFTEQKANAEREGSAEGFIEVLSRIERKWLGDWLGEFACDAIGTYLVGDAYGWANFYLCAHTRSSDTVFMPNIGAFPVAVHPSDESRMRAIFLVLKKMKPDLSLNELAQGWSEYIATLTPEKPDHYDFFYPDQILRELAKLVIQRCEEIGLRSFISSLKMDHNPNIVELINTAWATFRSDPDNYLTWEKENLSHIKTKLLPT